MSVRLLAGGLTAVLALTLSATVAIPAGGAPAGGAPAAQPPAPAAGKIETEVIRQLDRESSTTFWVSLDSQADLPAAGNAEAVFEAKTAHAERSQAGLRALLAEHGARFEPFWLDNSIKVTGDAALAAELAARPEVARVEADDRIAMPPQPAPTSDVGVMFADWNLHAINAPRVWDELGVRGEGVVVAHIDTGVYYQHPGLVSSYRGRAQDGAFDHDHNWFDATGYCTDAPCDPDLTGGHGTHVMGTMVGREGVLESGVAPGAEWISARACDTGGCERRDLLAAGQWILAPTDVDGQNPRPDLAPDIVNNSWAGTAGDRWYDETVRAWVAAGIFPVFGAGNDGATCGNAGEPGAGADAYAVGATDSSGRIADFSSRGPGADGAIKPDLAAPGVGIRSTSNYGGYVRMSGTSMAAPHTAGTVALMWSHSPGIHGDIAATKAALDGTAVDVEDLSCGGTAEDNNVYGEGRLDAYAAVTANPRGSIGALGGMVTVDGAGRGGVAVTVSGPHTRRVVTDPAGRFSLPRLVVGEYTVRAELFGYLTSTDTVTVTEGGTVTSEHTLAPAPHATVSGTVRSASGPLAAVSVTALGTPAIATSGADGRYTLRLPLGDYRLQAESTNRCALPAAAEAVSLTGDVNLDFTLTERVDEYGYRCGPASAGWVGGTEQLNIDHGVSNYLQQVQLPFPFTLYGRTYRTATVYAFGFVGFGGPVDFDTAQNPAPLPSAAAPNAALYAFWDDWDMATGSVYTAVTGTAPNRTFVVEWRDVYHYPAQRISFAALLGEDGTVTYRYRDIPSGEPYSAGQTAWIGLENADGSTAYQYSGGEPTAHDGLAFTFQPGRTGVVRGGVTDANDQLSVAGATATLSRDGDTVATDITGGDGGYAFQVPPGDYQLTIERAGYRTGASAVTVTAGTAAYRPAVLRTARVTAPASATWVVPAAEDRQRTVQLGNAGVAGTDYTVSERADVPWLTVADGGSGGIAPGQQIPVSVSLDTDGLPAGSVHRVELVVASESGRQPELTVPVTLVVPAQQFAIDTGANRGLVDSQGDSWQADQAHRLGSYGYIDRSRARSTRESIAGTTDPARFRTLREGMHSYQFDGLTPGVYTVELDFAELTGAGSGDRVFDLLAEGTEVLAGLDVAHQVGTRTALHHRFTVEVTDGSLEVEFASNGAYDPAIVNAIRVTHRPDLS